MTPSSRERPRFALAHSCFLAISFSLGSSMANPFFLGAAQMMYCYFIRWRAGRLLSSAQHRSDQDNLLWVTINHPSNSFCFEKRFLPYQRTACHGGRKEHIQKKLLPAAMTLVGVIRRRLLSRRRFR